MTLNTELLSTLVKWAGQDEADLKKFFEEKGFPEWDQNTWGNEIRNGACRTACCIAGNAVIQTGWALAFDPEDSEQVGDHVETYAEYCGPKIKVGEDDNGNPIYDIDPDGPRAYIPDRAREVLGISGAEGHHLFKGSNNLADVVFLARAIALVHNETLDIPQSLIDISEDSKRRSETHWFADIEAMARDMFGYEPVAV